MSTEPASTSQKKILVIDDNEIILKTTSMKLQSAGYQVFTALDGSEGVAAVRKEKPDLVLLDITFPPDVSGMSWDGFRIMDWLHRVDETKRFPSSSSAVWWRKKTNSAPPPAELWHFSRSRSILTK